MPGCRLYLVAIDETDADGVWVTEVWESEDAHRASLQLQRVRDQIARATPVLDIAGFKRQRLDASRHSELTAQPVNARSESLRVVRLSAARRAPARAGRREDHGPDTPTRAPRSTTTGHVATSMAHGVRCLTAYVAGVQRYLAVWPMRT